MVPPFFYFMSMKRFIYFAFLALTLCACGGGDDDKSGNSGNESNSTSTDAGIIGWYTRQDMAGFWLDLVSDDTTYSFNTEGEIIGVSSMWGTEQNFSGSLADGNEVYYIPDDETFIRYYVGTYKENAPAANGKTLLYRFNYSYLGTLGLYATSTTYYTYWREGNKLYTTEDGWTVYTVTPTGIIPDGSSFVYSKYDPNKVY